MEIIHIIVQDQDGQNNNMEINKEQNTKRNYECSKGHYTRNIRTKTKAILLQ